MDFAEGDTMTAMSIGVSVLVATYALIMSEKINRSIVALLGALVMIVLGILSQEQAIEGIDFNTIGLLVGMMIIVSVTRKSGVFEYLAIWSAKKANANPAGILAMLAVVTAVMSAFLDNVTTVLLVVPVTLVITEQLKVDPYPFLFSTDPGFQHWRHGNADRRSAQHPYRHPGRTLVQ